MSLKNLVEDKSFCFMVELLEAGKTPRFYYFYPETDGEVRISIKLIISRFRRC